MKLEPFYKQSLGKVYIDWGKASRVEVENGETSYRFAQPMVLLEDQMMIDEMNPSSD